MNRITLPYIYVALHHNICRDYLPSKFVFLQYLQLWSEFEQEVSFHYNKQNGNVFLFWDSYLQGPKKVYSIYGHIILMSQWPWFRARHIVFMRYTDLPNLIILEQVVFSLWVWQDFPLFGHIILLEGHSDSILKCDTSSTWAVPADRVGPLGMIVFKLWSGQEVDRWTDMIAIP
jgi:hypothetical protein